MLTVYKGTGAFTPANNDEANGEIIGRCNALHDWLMDEAIENSRLEYLSAPLTNDLRTVCTLMGFRDVLAIKKEEKEKASGANAD